MDKQEISVRLDDDNDADAPTTIRYEMRGLSEEEIKPWAEFCASVFGYKANPPPPSYFERHFRNDPRRDASLVRVIVTADTQEIVSSCRIFCKTISLGNGKVVEAGGIGEVCTSENHRKRGLSKLLLQNAIDIMTGRGMQVSFLHAAPSFLPVYEKAGGYECTTTQWSVWKVEKKMLVNVVKEGSPSPIVSNRLASFPSDTPRLRALHKDYSEDRFCGCIVRSEQYWNEYIRQELEGSLWVLTTGVNDKIIGFISVRSRGSRFQLRDFGCDKSAIPTGQALVLLLRKTMKDVVEDSFELLLPTAVWTEVKQEFSELVAADAATQEDDLGWMYKTLQDGAPVMTQICASTPSLIWPADSF